MQGQVQVLERHDGLRPMYKVALLTHSYGVKLDFSNNFNITSHHWITPEVHAQLRVFAQRGAKLATIRETEVVRDLLAFQPQICVLLLGGNDIDREDISPKFIAKEIEDLSKFLESRTGGKCMIYGLNNRTLPRGITAKSYKAKRNSINKLLKQTWSEYCKERFHHTHLTDDHLKWDGIHLNDKGNFHLKTRIIADVVKFYAKINAE